MLIVRRDQVAAFESELQERFAQRMVPYIARTYPDHFAVLGEDGARLLVKKGMALGDRHGIPGEHEQAGLILLMVEYGERFERVPERAWAERMLEDQEVPGQVRVSAIRARFASSTDGRRLAPPSAPTSL